MPQSTSSHRHVLRILGILGSSAVIQIAIGVLKVKALALLAGPSGVGLAGLFAAVLSVGTSTAGIGLGQGAVREIAAKADDPASVAVIRRALFWGSVALGLLGALVMIALAEPIAAYAMGDAALASQVRWLAGGVAVAVVAAGQAALLNGLQQIRALAVLGVVVSALAAVAGVGFAVAWGPDGAIGFTLAVPVASLLVGTILCARLPRVPQTAWRWRELLPLLRRMAGLGFAMTLAGIAGHLAQVTVRALIVEDLGLEAVGHFQAAWTVSYQYMGVILAALAMDFFPRLSAVADDRPRAARLVNEQFEIALLFAGPVLTCAMVFSPIAIQILYTADFAESAQVLRWQILGDIVKIAAWPLGFLLLAQRAGTAFFMTDLLWAASYPALVALLLPSYGLEAAGMAFLASYTLYLGSVVLAAPRFGCTISAQNWRYLAESALYLVAGFAVADHGGIGPLAIGVALIAAQSATNWRRMRHNF
ncbi:O-antigen translocase [Chthonobacter albigriseus]|uniref:O-antigen translocase n=1 Tax=Chthonobacter albigriseus TaxID=1683161 RepID=UPI0015EE8111|nr:O-antigen translocase [Chthonobacter albigriseus]